MTVVPVEHLRDPQGALVDFTLENGGWTQGADPEKCPRYFPEAKILRTSDGEISAIAFPRAVSLEDWLKEELIGQVPVHAEFLSRDLWPEVEIGYSDIELGPNEFIQYDQGPAWEALVKEPDRWPFGRILALACGKGKTALALKLAHHRRVRTLVICHTLDMAEQWSDEAEKFLGIEKSRHGFIGDGKVDWQDKDIVFSSMPGLVCREYPESFWYRWGLTIADEGDLLGAVQMRQILSKFYGERLLVTATLERKDGNDALFYLHVGGVCFTDTDDDIIPKVVVVESPVGEFIPVERADGKIDYKSSEQTIYSKRYRKHVPHLPKTVSLLGSYMERKVWCLDVVEKLLEEGRKILFIGGRVADLKWFHAQAQDRFPGYTSGIVLGKANGLEDGESKWSLKNADIIWGIYQLAKRGMNERTIDTVVLQFSQVNEPGAIRQLVGRACRYHPDKKDPLVVLMNDQRVGCLDANTMKIVQQLKDRGSEVTWYDD